MEKDKLISWIQEMDQELKDILDFWINQAVDNEKGGFVGELSRQGVAKEGAEKGAVLNARILWTFSAAYGALKEPKYLELADRAYTYLIDHFWDNKNGGVYWSLDSDGNVLNSRKQAYAQGFAIYGLSEYYKVSNKMESLDKAVELYQLIDTHFKDNELGGYIEALDESWQPLEDMRLSEKDANEPKSMNTHLHIIEPYTNLYRVWPDEGLKKSIQHLIHVFRDHVIDQNTGHFELFFDYDWTVKSGIVSYGHDIEGAWLLTEAAHFINDHELLAEMQPIALKMVDATLAEGMDPNGGLNYEAENGHVDTDKHWWPQAEALVGLIEAFQISKDSKYLVEADKIWSFIKNHMTDKEYGEWFWKVDKEKNASYDVCKVGFWKCPYHNSRALMEAINRIKAEIE